MHFDRQEKITVAALLIFFGVVVFWAKVDKVVMARVDNFFTGKCNAAQPYTQWHDCIGAAVGGHELTHNYNDGAYVGKWMFGKPHGYGKMSYTYGGSYAGLWLHGKKLSRK